MQSIAFVCLGIDVRIAFVVVLTGLILPSWAHAGAPRAQTRQIHLSAQEVHERCVDLAAGQQLSYAYSASQSLEFAIRYREGERETFAVRRKARSNKGKLTSRADGTYCLSWNNPNARGLNAYYQFSVHAPKPSRSPRP